MRRACVLTTTVFNKLVTGETLVKCDKCGTLPAVHHPHCIHTYTRHTETYYAPDSSF